MVELSDQLKSKHQPTGGPLTGCKIIFVPEGTVTVRFFSKIARKEDLSIPQVFLFLGNAAFPTDFISSSSMYL